MRPVVRAAFPAYTDRLEGTVYTMYTDVENLVTVGRGNLIDPVEIALLLPWWVLRYDEPATEAQIRAEWQRVKDGGFAKSGWQAAAKDATLHLSPEDVDALTLLKLDANDVILAGRFAEWSVLPAAVQLATHSLAWACGPRFAFPRFEAAMAARDWPTCAVESHLDETGNPGLAPRNRAQAALFAYASTGDPDTLPDLP